MRNKRTGRGLALIFMLVLLVSCGEEVISPEVPKATPVVTPTATPIPLEADRYRMITENNEVWIVDNTSNERIAELPFSQEHLEKTGDGNSDGGEIAAGSY